MSFQESYLIKRMSKGINVNIELVLIFFLSECFIQIIYKILLCFYFQWDVDLYLLIILILFKLPYLIAYWIYYSLKPTINKIGIAVLKHGLIHIFVTYCPPIFLTLIWLNADDSSWWIMDFLILNLISVGSFFGVIYNSKRLIP